MARNSDGKAALLRLALHWSFKQTRSEVVRTFTVYSVGEILSSRLNFRHDPVHVLWNPLIDTREFGPSTSDSEGNQANHFEAIVLVVYHERASRIALRQWKRRRWMLIRRNETRSTLGSYLTRIFTGCAGAKDFFVDAGRRDLVFLGALFAVDYRHQNLSQHIAGFTAWRIESSVSFPIVFRRFSFPSKRNTHSLSSLPSRRPNRWRRSRRGKRDLICTAGKLVGCDLFWRIVWMKQCTNTRVQPIFKGILSFST